MKRIFFSTLIFVFALACKESHEQKASFHHGIESSSKPWNKEPMEVEGDFSFAIISDLTGGERKRIFEVAVEQINGFDP